MPIWPPRTGLNGHRPHDNQHQGGGREDEPDESPDRPEATVAGALAPALVVALAVVLSVGLLSSVAVVAICRLTPGTPEPQGVCLDSGEEAERRWEFAVSTIVTLLAGRSLKP